MGIFDVIKKSIFGSSFDAKLMKTINKPVFIKDFNKENEEIIKLNQFLNNTKDEEEKKKLQNDLYVQKYVQDGLSKVYSELINSPVPFYGLHDVKIEYKDNNTHIDFLLITNQFCLIVKCKSLQGNIEIDSQGSFYRWMKKGEKWSKEGFYSPIEQNRRAELVLKDILKDKLNIDKLPVISLTVFTNPKATLNFKQCSNDILSKVIKLDILNTKLVELVQNNASAVYDEVKAVQIAEALVEVDCSKQLKQNTKEEYINTENVIQEFVSADLSSHKVDLSIDKEVLTKALKAYRTSMATSNSIPPYFIYNNEEMSRLIEAMPKTKDELLKVRGFGQVKVDKYGEDILNIIKSACK